MKNLLSLWKKDSHDAYVRDNSDRNDYDDDDNDIDYNINDTIDNIDDNVWINIIKRKMIRIIKNL